MFGLGRKRERLWRDGGGVACSMLGPGLAGMFLELREWFSSSLILIYMYEDMMQACTHKQHTYTCTVDSAVKGVHVHVLIYLLF